jgi:hypothetical protein
MPNKVENMGKITGSQPKIGCANRLIFSDHFQQFHTIFADLKK